MTRLTFNARPPVTNMFIYIRLNWITCLVREVWHSYLAALFLNNEMHLCIWNMFYVIFTNLSNYLVSGISLYLYCFGLCSLLSSVFFKALRLFLFPKCCNIFLPLDGSVSHQWAHFKQHKPLKRRSDLKLILLKLFFVFDQQNCSHRNSGDLKLNNHD